MIAGRIVGRRLSSVSIGILCAFLLLGCSTPKIDSGSSFYRLVENDGIWWFQDSAGKRFVSIGINHLEPVLLQTERHRWATQYGADLFDVNGRAVTESEAARRWMLSAIGTVEQWGFNTLGVHNPVEQDRMPYVAVFRPFAINGWRGVSRTYPDPFDDATATTLRASADHWCAEHADDPLILGISFNDMPIWNVPGDGYNDWVRSLLALPAGAPGKREWIDVLRPRYRSAREASLVYGIQAESWDELAAAVHWPRPSDPARASEDQLAFLPRIADRWYGLESAAIRECDPNHLIFGDKLSAPLDMPEWLDPILGRYFDAILVQWYATAEYQLSRLRKLHASTGRPVLLGDSTFSTPTDSVPRPKGVRVGSQRDVGRSYAGYLQKIMAEPFVVGWHHCGYMEGSAELARVHPYFSFQNGFLTASGTPHAEAVEQVRRANALAHGWHEGSRTEDARATDGEPPLCTTFFQADATIHQVGERVFVVRARHGAHRNVPNKSISFILTDDGAVAIDAGFRSTAGVARRILRQITSLPLRYLIYTHHHGTQVQGAAVLRDPQTEIVAHEDLVREFDFIRQLGPYHARLNSIQFDLPLESQPTEVELVYPDLTYADRYDLELGGTRIELIHVEGEAEGYSLIHLPDERIVWVGDLLARSIPMVASPMKKVRDPIKWRDALTRVRALEPRVLINSVDPPKCGEDSFLPHLDLHVEALEFLHESVAREMNRGSTVEQALANIRLPEHMRSNPRLLQRYGSLEFAIRGLYHRYSGWFDQNGSRLQPAAPKQRALAFADAMGGRERVLDRARALFDSGKLPLALEFADVAIDAFDDPQAHLLKADVFAALAEIPRENKLKGNMYRKLSAIERRKASPNYAEVRRE